MEAEGKDYAPLKLRLLAVVCGLVIVAASGVALYSIKSTREVVTGMAEAFRPQSKFNVVLGGTIGQLNNNPKLVVLTADVEAKVIQENTTTFAGVTVGSATATAIAPAKVQWYVPVNLLSSRDFVFDKEKKKLVVTVPRPELDRDFVQLDPGQVKVQTDVGFSPLSIFKAPNTQREAVEHLKAAAIHQGEHELLRDRADKNAKEIVAKQLAPVAEILNEGVSLEVEFKK